MLMHLWLAGWGVASTKVVLWWLAQEIQLLQERRTKKTQLKQTVFTSFSKPTLDMWPPGKVGGGDGGVDVPDERRRNQMKWIKQNCGEAIYVLAENFIGFSRQNRWRLWLCSKLEVANRWRDRQPLWPPPLPATGNAQSKSKHLTLEVLVNCKIIAVVAVVGVGEWRGGYHLQLAGVFVTNTYSPQNFSSFHL